MAARSKGSFASRALRFFATLRAPRVPCGVQVMNPYREGHAREYLGAFLQRYFNDAEPRTLIFGINPGRFGAGVTGIAFTDPVALADFCGIANPEPRRRELSSVFVYNMIEAVGGVDTFYRRFFLTAICPLGFTRRGVNMNYYDDRALEKAVTPFITRTIQQQIGLGGRRDRAIVLGTGENLRFMRALNDKHRFFGEIVGLDHPRFIMQYRRKGLLAYIDKYVATLGLSTWQAGRVP